jgi:hypothetical protein
MTRLARVPIFKFAFCGAGFSQAEARATWARSGIFIGMGWGEQGTLLMQQRAVMPHH